MTTTNNSVFAVVYRSLNAWEAQLMQQALRSEGIESFMGIPLFFHRKYRCSDCGNTWRA